MVGYTLAAVGYIGKFTATIRALGLASKATSGLTVVFSGIVKIGQVALRAAQWLGILGWYILKVAQYAIMAAGRGLLVLGRAILVIGRMFLATPLGIFITLLSLLIYYWDDVKAAAISAWEGISIAFNHGLMIIKDSINGALQWVQSMISTFFASGSELWEAFTGGISTAINGPVELVQQSFSAMVSFIQDSITSAVAWIENMGTTFFTSGAALWEAFTSGIRSALSGPVKVVQQGLQWIRNLLPFSDAKEGPLSQLTRSGRALMSTLAEGVGIEAPVLKERVSNGLSIPVLQQSFQNLLPKVPPEGDNQIASITPSITVSLDIAGLAAKLSERTAAQQSQAESKQYHFHFGTGAIVLKVDNMEKPQDFFVSLKQLAVELGGGE